MKIKEKIYNLLRSSEKYTQSDMVSLMKDSTWMTASKIIITIAALAVTVALANLLPPAIYGQYKFILSLFGIVVAFSLTGMGTAIIQSVSRGFDKSFLVAVKTHLRWSFVMIVVALLMAGYYFFKGNNALGISLVIIGFAAPIMQALTLYNPYLQGKRRFKTEAFYNFWYNTIPAVFLIIAAFITDSLIAMVATYFISYSLVTLFIFFRVKKQIPEDAESDPQTTSYGKHLSLMNVLGALSFQLDKVLIFHYLGAVQLAVYTIALAAPQQLRHINKLVSTISLTRLPNLPIPTIKKVLPRKMFILFGIAVGMVIVYVLLAPLFYNIFFPTYTDAIIYSQLYSLIILFLPISLLQQTLTAHMKKKELYVLQVSMPIVKIGSLAVLLPIYGIIGALSAILIAEVFRAILISYFYRRLS